jgi:hypothetical protein
MSVVTKLSGLAVLGLCLASYAAEPPAAPVSKETAMVLRERLAVLVNNAVTANAFDDMLASLSKYNRDRIAEAPLSDYQRINEAIDRVRKSYRAAYGRELVISADAFREVSFSVDEDADHSRASTGATGQLDLQLVREGTIANRWRLQLTNPTAESLAYALTMRLDSLAASQWPRDAAAGQRLVGLTVLEALSAAKQTPIVQNASTR